MSKFLDKLFMFMGVAALVFGLVIITKHGDTWLLALGYGLVAFSYGLAWRD